MFFFLGFDLGVKLGVCVWVSIMKPKCHNQIKPTMEEALSENTLWLRAHVHVLQSEVTGTLDTEPLTTRYQVWAQYDEKKDAMATSLTWDQVKRGSAIAVWSMSGAMSDLSGEQGLGPPLNQRALLFTLPPFRPCSEVRSYFGSFGDNYINNDMAFVHVGEDGWFLLAPIEIEHGVVVYNLHTKQASLYSEGRGCRPSAMATHDNVVVCAFEHWNEMLVLDKRTINVFTIDAEGAMTKTRIMNVVESCFYLGNFRFSTDGTHLAMYAKRSIGHCYTSSLTMLTTSNWGTKHAWEWTSEGRDWVVGAILAVDASCVTVLSENLMVTFKKTTRDFEVLGGLRYPSMWGAGHAYSDAVVSSQISGAFFWPQHGFVAFRNGGLVVFVHQMAKLKLKMSEVRVAWMHAVCRGIVRRFCGHVL